MRAVPARIWSQEEWDRIQLGYQARSMDEKWDIFAEDGELFIHRSWTGYGIYQASFVASDGGFRISEAFVEADATRYRSRSDEFDVVLFELVVCGHLLHEECAELRNKFKDLAR
ncbi:hypothetical protein Airi02_033920 [Actinoallomurus iriomotensis]|uniref:Uncharacterized protein n=2 Tax=Actinoallomurus iriomotensis TaxID=478107 RepID=A0A9W6VUD2_9ACTN|nr:hypothetical protein Airi02_033920 [Actinoallomurus iriomotensis]